jgi:hypothetical protein
MYKMGQANDWVKLQPQALTKRSGALLQLRPADERPSSDVTTAVAAAAETAMLQSRGIVPRLSTAKPRSLNAVYEVTTCDFTVKH